jgi:Starch-binding associating with outer membrane
MQKIYAFFLVFTLLAGAGCSKYVDGLEFSPNSPATANTALLTTVVQVATFSHYGGQLARISAIFSQQCAGTLAQYEDISNYAIFEGDNDNEWQSLYSTLNDCNLLIEAAGTANLHYRGLGKVLKAMNLALATDLWGDIPNKEAGKGIQGPTQFNPAYDTQQSVYADMQLLLTEGIADLSSAAGGDVIGNDDIMFLGDTKKWIITANILKARYANRLSKRDPAGSATQALNAIDAALAAGLSNSGSDANAIFPGEGNSLNQWYAFEQAREDYLHLGAGFIDLLKSISDPRLVFYADTALGGVYRGVPLGEFDTDASPIGAYFASKNSSTPLVTYVEAKFIEAEAALRAGFKPRAATAHNEAIKAHIALVTGAPAPATYVTAQASETAATITLAKIMTHKYVAGFTQVEAYNDWRRTGIPALTPNSNAVNNGIPRRLPTPLTERLYNTKAKSITDILKPVWWDE